MFHICSSRFFNFFEIFNDHVVHGALKEELYIQRKKNYAKNIFRLRNDFEFPLALNVNLKILFHPNRRLIDDNLPTKKNRKG